jgi:molybdate-binding protein
MVAPGNPKKIYGLSDLPRPDVRFINRQSGSGTRFLLDLMLRKRGIDSAAIRGYEQCEFTHAAVAAYVASGMADAAFGVEVPARQFRLEFLPSQTERYFFLCDVRTLESPEMKRMRAMLASDEYRRLVDALPGYEAKSMGTVATLEEAFASFRPRARRAGGPTRRR